MGRMFIQQNPQTTAQMRLAQGLLKKGTDSSPVQHPFQGLARIVQALAGKSILDETSATDKADRSAANEALMRGLGAKPWQNPDAGPVMNENGVPYAPGQEPADAAVGGTAGASYALGQMPENYYAQQAAPGIALQGAQAQAAASQREAERAAQFENQKALQENAARLKPGPAPKTIKTAEGVFLQNPDGTLGERLGSPPAGLSVNMGAQEKEFDKAMGKQYAQTLIDTQAKARSSRTLASNIGGINKMLENVYTGAGSQTALSIKKAAQGAGITLDLPENIGAAEAAQSLANKMSLELRNPAGGAGMPGAMSDNDRIFLVSMTPGMAQSKEGRKTMADVANRIASRDEAVARLARTYAAKNNGRLDIGFEKELAEFSKANPLFAGLKVPDGAAPLPEGVSEEDILETMRANGMTREQVLQRLGGK